MNKSALREYYKHIRQSIENREEKEKALFSLLCSYKPFIDCTTVFLYYPSNCEASTVDIIDEALRLGKKVALPLCSDRDGNMEFYLISSQNDLISGMYGIMEPDKNICPIAYPDESTLITVPALAFDKKGYRLGYGKGYYDRYLQRFCVQSVGLAFEECLTDELPKGIFDKKVSCVITDKTVYIFD